MNGGEISVIMVVAIVMLASIIKAGAKAGPGVHYHHQPDGESKAENERLRGQVQQLQDRIRVLERIVTDRGVETAGQIEALRERDRLGVEDKAE